MNKFFEYFNIPKIEYREPSRTWSGDEVDYYVEYDYPSAEPVICDLINYYNMQLNGKSISIENLTESNLCKTVCMAILARVKELSKTHNVEIEKEDIRAIFIDVYGGDEE